MELPYTYFMDLEAVTAVPPEDSIVSRTLHNSEAMKVTLFTFAAGQALSEHTASMPAVLHFISGQALLTLGGDEQIAQANTWAAMPANLPHSIVAETAVTMLLILIKQ
ncbi:MAG: cupin domain-containing protein [Anaerolineales bacterium]|nr:cupin domain-containing protein [Anaerolineales bacterium]